MIDHIAEFTHKNGNKTIKVFYKSGRVYTFGTNDNLPSSMLDKYLNGKAETIYTYYGKVTYIR